MKLIRLTATTSAALVALVTANLVGAERSPTQSPLELFGAPSAVNATSGVFAAFADRDAEEAVGTIRGRITVDARPARRRVNRYAGRIEAARAPQPVPTAVYLREAVPGRPMGVSGDALMPQRDTAFARPLLFVPVGTEVAFPNEDPFLHNVFSYSPAARFDLGRYAQGDSKSVTFDQAGEVSVLCEVHETMRARIVVVRNPFHAEVGEDGAFELAGVPAGTYTLVVTHADIGSVERVVTVSDGGVTEVEISLG